MSVMLTEKAASEVKKIIAEQKLDQAQLKDSLISGMQKHADIDKPEEVNEMA